jgi:misacylated tRNA(Ala) deacylase
MRSSREPPGAQLDVDHGSGTRRAARAGAHAVGAAAARRGPHPLLEIPGVDLQPCGGTHVAATGEIGPVVVTKVENKGRHNKRVVIAFA